MKQQLFESRAQICSFHRLLEKFKPAQKPKHDWTSFDMAFAVVTMVIELFLSLSVLDHYKRANSPQFKIAVKNVLVNCVVPSCIKKQLYHQ